MTDEERRPRYALGNDGNGRVVRMDTLTGKAWVLASMGQRDGSTVYQWFPVSEPSEAEDKPK